MTYDQGSCSFAPTMMNKENNIVISLTYDSHSFQIYNFSPNFPNNHNAKQL